MGKNLIIDENMHGHVSDNENAIPTQIEYCNFQEDGPIFPPHWHEQLIMMFINKGTLALQCGSREIIAEPNTIVLVNPNELHSGENLESILEYFLIKIDLLLLLGDQPNLQQTMYTELLLKNQIMFENKIAKDDILPGHIKDIIKEFQNKEEGYELAIRGLSFQILALLLRKYVKTVQDHSELEMHYRRLNQIKPAINYMENHMAEKITLVELSEVTHLSTIHFSRVFKNVSGLSPMDYLNQMRVQKAAQLLLKTDLPIMEIALETGFNDSNYFSRYFRKCRKVTPSEYREKFIK